jgi:AcrR family transcriptional regulator
MFTRSTTATADEKRRRRGRPTAPQAASLGDAILDVAAALFLRDGYAATSIEAVARQAGVAKRTCYARFPDKAALFQAMVHRLIAGWLGGSAPAFTPGPLPAALHAAGRRILDVALTPEALALRRLIIAESARFPELARAMHQAGADSGATMLATLLRPDAPDRPDTRLAGRQFMALVLSDPVNRATVGEAPPGDAEREEWVAHCVALFLDGWRAQSGERAVPPL